MPLHLLGKKSWNVYNPENIARVRRDEAAAHARDEERERQQRSNEADTRLKLLRGEEDSTLSRDVTNNDSNTPYSRSRNDSSRKRRKLNGEDDTDRDIRLAIVDTKVASRESHAETLFDSKGHIDLVPGKARETKDKSGTERQDESVGMRFSDAAGYRTKGQPWYTNHGDHQESDTTMNEDVWGNDDPRRQEREQQRIATNDPLAAMRKGVKQLRENEKQRKEWMEQRERDLYEVERLARKSKRRRRRRSSDEDSLDGFSLGAPRQDHARSTSRTADPGRDPSRRHHRSRHRSGSRERRHHRHRHRAESSKE